MWLRTYICVVTITIEALIHICMNHTKTQTLLPINFWGPQIYYCCLGAKRNMFQGFVWWAKNTARGVRFLLRFNMYLFLDQGEEVYHSFWHFPYIIRTYVCSMRAPITVATFQYICDRFVVFDDFSILRHPEIPSLEARGWGPWSLGVRVGLAVCREAVGKGDWTASVVLLCIHD